MEELQALVDEGCWIWPHIDRILGDTWEWRIRLSTNMPDAPTIETRSADFKTAIYEAICQANNITN